MSYIANTGAPAVAMEMVEALFNFLDAMGSATMEDDTIKSITFSDMMYDVIYMGLRSRGKIPENTEVLTLHHHRCTVIIRRENPYPRPSLPDDAIDL